MINFSFFALFFLRTAFFSLPLHLNPASLGATILFIVVSILVYFLSVNITIVAIFTLLVYVRGILILFSYFFSLIQNTKIFLIPLIFSFLGFCLCLLYIFLNFTPEIIKETVFIQKSSSLSSFTWVLSDIKLIILLVLILLLRILFIEKVIGLKQKPLRVK